MAYVLPRCGRSDQAFCGLADRHSETHFHYAAAFRKNVSKILCLGKLPAFFAQHSAFFEGLRPGRHMCLAVCCTGARSEPSLIFCRFSGAAWKRPHGLKGQACSTGLQAGLPPARSSLWFDGLVAVLSLQKKRTTGPAVGWSCAAWIACGLARGIATLCGEMPTRQGFFLRFLQGREGTVRLALLAVMRDGRRTWRRGSAHDAPH